MAWILSTMPPIPRPPGFDAHFDMFVVMMAFNVLMTLAISALVAWIIKRLMSSDIRREFGASA